VYSAIKIAGPAKCKVGDSVRVSKYKTVFEKGYTPNCTTEMFKIVKVQRTNSVTYLFEDYRGKSIAGVNMSCIARLIQIYTLWKSIA